MVVLRALLFGLAFIALLAVPLGVRVPASSTSGTSALAAPVDPAASGEIRQDDNDNDVADDNDNDVADDNDNDEAADDNDNDEDTAESAAEAPPPVAVTPEPPDVASACATSGSQAQVKLIQDAGSGTLTVPAGHPQDTEITLSDVSPSSVPATPGVVVSDFVFNIAASTPCGAGAGPGLAAFPTAVNFGVSYDPSQFPQLNEASFVIMRLEGEQWVPVDTSIADPNANFISATITRTGTYAVVAR